MSTKCTVKYGEKFHLYEECFDDQNIYLQLDGAGFSATSAGGEVCIPLSLWEYIRNSTHSILSSRYAGKTDEEIVSMVKAEIAGRTEEDKAFYNRFAISPEKEETGMVDAAIEIRDNIQKVQDGVKELTEYEKRK